MGEALQQNSAHPNLRREVNGIILHHSLVEDLSVLEAASLKERALALSIDWAILGTLQKLGTLPLLLLMKGSDQASRSTWLLIISVLIYLAYHLPMLKTGQTLGKVVLGIRVVRADGQAPLSLQAVLLREVLGRILSYTSFGLGFLLAVTRNDRRALHDIVAKTRVVRAYGPYKN